MTSNAPDISLFPTPVIARYGSHANDAPTVVLLHGRGSNEQQIMGLAEHLPTGPSYLAVRAPIAEAGGYAWFANRGIGRPVAESLAETMRGFVRGLTRPSPRRSCWSDSAEAPPSPVA